MLVYLGLGSNLGQRLVSLLKAQCLISKKLGTIRCQAPIYESDPWGSYTGENYRYLNTVIALNTNLAPLVLLREIHKIEKKLGRVRTSQDAPRTIDIDILFYGKSVIQHPDLQVPHPHLIHRDFVLRPMFDLAPDFGHPELKETIKALLAHCSTSQVLGRG